MDQEARIQLRSLQDRLAVVFRKRAQLRNRKVRHGSCIPGLMAYLNVLYTCTVLHVKDLSVKLALHLSVTHMKLLKNLEGLIDKVQSMVHVHLSKRKEHVGIVIGKFLCNSYLHIRDYFKPFGGKFPEDTRKKRKLWHLMIGLSIHTNNVIGY